MNVALGRTTARTIRLGLAMVAQRAHPYSISFTLTNRCNFRCDYCNVPDAAAYELTRDELEDAISEFADAGMARASFSGGEALLRPDAVEIIRHAKSKGCFTSLNSNGWLTANALDGLEGALDMLMVSLDGPAEVHDLVRRRRGSYDRAVRAIDEARRRGISVASIAVIGPWNLDRLPEMIDLAKRMGFWAYFQPAYEDCFTLERGLRPGLDPQVLAQVADHLVAASRSAPIGSSIGYFERLRRAPAFGDCSRCAAGRYFATVLPDGRVVPCHLTSHLGDYANGRDIGFVPAFRRIPRPSGPGCAVSPYQESDLIFGLDPRAVLAALRRAVSPPNAHTAE